MCLGFPIKALWMNAGLRNAGPRCKNGRAASVSPSDTHSLVVCALIEASVGDQFRLVSEGVDHEFPSRDPVR